MNTLSSELFSSKDLAEMNLSVLPTSKQGIEYRAKKDNWSFKEIAGKGRGGKLKKFLFSGLPNLNLKLAKIFFKAAQSHIFFNRKEVFHAD